MLTTPSENKLVCVINVSIDVRSSSKLTKRTHKNKDLIRVRLSGSGHLSIVVLCNLCIDRKDTFRAITRV